MAVNRAFFLAVGLLAALQVALALDCQGGTTIRANADCEGSTFDGTDFNNIDANGVNFEGSTFTDIMFDQGSFLDDASFAESTFGGDSIFEGVSANRVDFSNLNLESSVTFKKGTENSALANATFDGTQGGKLILTNAFAEDASFRNVNTDFELSQGNFREADFTGADIGSLKTTDGVYGGASFNGAKIDDLDITGGAFSENGGVSFANANLGNVNINKPDLTGVSFSGATISGGAISGELTGANFEGATITGVDFADANLEGASFMGATFNDVTFSESILTDATFSQSSFEDVTIMNTEVGGTDFFDVTDNGGISVSGVGDNCCLACAAPAIDCGNECRRGCASDITQKPQQTLKPAETARPEQTESAESSETEEETETEATPNSDGEIPTSDPDSSETSGPEDTDSDATETPDEDGEDDDVCFPASATVELRNGETKTMKDLAVGDVVRVSESEFSEVYFFSHKLEASQHRMVRITADDTSVVEMTGSHYLYVNNELSAAKNVQIGDSIKTVRSGNALVKSVEIVLAKGLYNPHTRHGDIVVDDVVTSTYTTSVSPSVAALLLLPERLASKFGVSLYGAMLEGQAPVLLTTARSAVLSRA